LLVAFSAKADLTATVTPGYTLTTGELPTTAKLNLLGTPVIRITGTIGGTNAGIAAGSVNGTMLSDSVASSNIVYNSQSPRGLEVAAGGVSAASLATNVAGLGLAGGLGTPLRVVVDGTTIIATNDTLRVGLINPTNVAIAAGYLLGGGAANFGTNINIGTGLTLSTAGTNATLYITNQTFTSAEFAITQGTVISTNHGFSLAPMDVRWVMVCKTNELNYIAGNELDVAAVWNDQNEGQFFAWGADATSVFIIPRASDGARAYNKSTGASSVNLTLVRWRLKAYARQ
jgi:hypothetical protein